MSKTIAIIASLVAICGAVAAVAYYVSKRDVDINSTADKVMQLEERLNTNTEKVEPPDQLTLPEEILTPIISILTPDGTHKITVEQRIDGGYFSVSGNLINQVNDPDNGIFLLVHPKSPKVAGWFVQPEATGLLDRWDAEAQVGNQEWPPVAGNTYMLIAIIAKRSQMTGKVNVFDPNQLRPIAISDTVTIEIGTVKMPAGK